MRPTPEQYTDAAKENDQKLAGLRALRQAQRNPNWIALKMKRKSVGFKYSPFLTSSLLNEAYLENAIEKYRRLIKEEAGKTEQVSA